MSKKLIALALAGVFAFTFSAKGVTVEELQAQIQSLLAQIAQLQQQLAAAQGGTTTTGLCLSTDLKYGMKGDAVKTLQEGLKQDPSVYPEGLVTGYFGPLTKAAVIRFQEKYASEILAPWGLTKGTGYVGSTTRAKFNALYCTPATTTTTTAPAETTTTTTTTTVPPTEGSIQVSTAGAYVESSLKWGDSDKPVLAFDVKALNSDMTVKRIDVQFYYDGSNPIFPWKTFKGFTLYSDGNEIKTIMPSKSDYIENTYGQDYTLRISGLNDVIAQGSTKTYVLKATVLDNPTNTKQYIVRLGTSTGNTTAIRAIDSAGLNQYAGGNSITNTVDIEDAVTTATVAVLANANNPKEGVIIGNANNIVSNQELLRFDLKSTGDDTTLRTLKVSITNSGKASAIKLYDGDNLLSSKASASTVTFDNLSVNITKDSTKTLSVKADIKPIDGSTVNEGDTISATLTPNATNVVAADSQDNTASITGSTITGNTMHLYTVAPSFTFVSGKVTPDANSSAVATAEIKFSVTANGGNVYLPGAISTTTNDNIVVTYYGATSTAITSGIIDTDATDGGNSDYLVEEGSTKTFTVTVSLSTSTAGTTGLLGAKINKIYWATDSGQTYNSTNTSWGFESFKSGAINLHD